MLAKLQAFLIAWLTRLKEADGQALVEYALILALIAVVVIFALKFLGHAVNNTINNIANAVNKT
ncbi:MAG: Flp family type IVb pilin [Sulfobacillus thermosulfidooxidans]|uniref:Flp family type IVb pilin n=1 Tax=Sulfobacillus thermosulfidooxidans TaxID=28034 RepID=A0A2T2WW79_SULTH|nr:MAG: Flp family type IVb pilin [Sulfobacillus thermosulfidooxidans]